MEISLEGGTKMEPKNPLRILPVLSLIILITGFCYSTIAETLYAGGSEPGKVYRYRDGLGDSVFNLIDV